MPSLLDHQAVVALFEERHFGRAARRLGVSQPALTARLRRLEIDVDARLFERGRGGVEPTAAGIGFVEHARKAIEASSQAVDAARSARTGLGLTLRVGVTQVAAYQVVPPVLSAFRELHPSARLRLTEGTTASLERALEQNMIDVAFLHPPLHAPGLSQRVLFGAQLARRVCNAAEPDRPEIRYPRHEAPVMMGEVDRLGPAELGSPEIQIEADTIISALALSKAGYGPAIVPSGFPEFGFGSAIPDEPLGDLALETSIAWRSLDRRPVIKAMLACAQPMAT